MMRKFLAVLLAICMLMAFGGALAEDTVSLLEQTVRSALDSAYIAYEYDEENQWFDLSFELDSALEGADVTIFLYDDMLCVSAYSPLQVTDEAFESMAIFTTLANSQIFYGHFTINYSYGVLSCDSCNVIESVLPSEDEVLTLVYMPVKYMDAFGAGIAAVCAEGANPYDAFEACRALLDQE
ncbi:MAG: hypothetical protein ACI4ML_00780 [Aristaeellaceae bacterium]